ncbi:MAG: hypothetical protein IJ880_03355 [Bacilli bacterium]|nr:hypothetical protein [Bacilli bacterium]
MKLPNKVYDIFKWIMFLGVPVGTFIVAVIAAVNTHDPAAIITAVFGGLSTLAGIIIKISDGEYQKELNGGK